MYKVRAWLAILCLRELRVLSWGREECLKFGVGRREVHGVAYIGVLTSTVKERIKHRHTHDTQRIKEMCTKIGGQRSHGWCGHTAPLAPPPSLDFCPGACACKVILEMLVLDFYLVGSASDRVRCT